MGFPMPTKSDRRWHVNNPFDELGLLHPRHRVIAALELSARQPVSVLEWRQRGLNGLVLRPRLGDSRHGRVSWCSLELNDGSVFSSLDCLSANFFHRHDTPL